MNRMNINRLSAIPMIQMMMNQMHVKTKIIMVIDIRYQKGHPHRKAKNSVDDIHRKSF